MTKKQRQHGPEAERLKIDLPLAEGLRRLVSAPPIQKQDSRYAKRKPKPKAG